MEKLKTKKFKLPIKKIIAVILVAAIGFGAYSYFKETEVQVTVELRESVATIGTVENLLDSSGTIEAYETYTISSLVDGEILEDYFELSDEVTEDQLLYHIDSSEIENNLTQAANSYTRQQNTYQSVMDSVADLNIRTSTAGTVMEVNVILGDTVSSNTQIAYILDLENMEITLPFHETDVANISVGDTAYITVQEVGETITGTVRTISNSTYISDTGSRVTEVAINVTNPGVLTDAYTGSATINGYSSAATSDFGYRFSQTVTAGTSGDISSINVIKGDKVTSNQIIAVAYDDDMDTTVQNATLTLEDSQISYEKTLDSLEDYDITSPITGTIMSKSYKAGDTIESFDSMAVIADMSKVKFEMSIDESNIQLIDENSQVIIVADAIEDKEYIGYIESIGLIGTAMSGVTTYPIVVVIEETDGLLPGMNVTADIVIDQAVDVVTIPSSYVSRGNIVLISEADAANYEVSDSGEPGTISPEPSPIEGYVYLCIATGVSDGTTVEVTAGLSEGTTVYSQALVVTGGTEAAAAGMEMGMMGGMDSGMSSGMPSGMPSGMSSSGMGMR
ncbi:MAG: efflux RND transporter periplasmic adaptor subunit [Clostridia bacterium]